MEDDQGASEDERSVELSSIEAIFPELSIDPKDPFTAVLDIPVMPEKPLKIYFQASTKALPVKAPSLDASNGIVVVSAAAAQVDTHELSYLPPLVVRITLPADYPANQPPQIRLSSHPEWIPRHVMKEIEEDCARLWNEIGQDQVVYTFIDHVQQAAQSAFGIGSTTEGRFELPGDLKISLLDFDLKKRIEQFEKETFDCGVCLEPKKGLVCHRLLLCGHVFCVACLQDVFNNAITEGDVNSVKCLAPGCANQDNRATPDGKRRKHDRTLNPSELLQIPVETEQVQRYVRLKRKKKLESDKNTIYCPRQWCQGAARSKKHPKPSDLLGDLDLSNTDSEEEDVTATTRKKKKKTGYLIPMSERLSVCEDCDFAFCSVCLKGWHGELAFCNPRRQAELDEEEKATMAYIERFSTACPTCNCRAQKKMGCNHMICFQCNTHFCYLCSAYLMEDNPYAHFNDFKSPCHMRLWELESGDGARAGLAFAGGDEAAGGAENEWAPVRDNPESDTASDSEDEDPDDFAEFGGDEIMLHIAEVEADAEQPAAAPHAQQRRNMHIEIVNFAGNGANQRIELPEPAVVAIPPPVPNPPRARHNAQRNQRQGNDNGHHRNGARLGNGRGYPANAPAQQVDQPGRANGLDRFLQLALNDQEDEWDSDELDEDDFDAAEPEPRVARRARA